MVLAALLLAALAPSYVAADHDPSRTCCRSVYPAKEFCSNCGLCDTHYIAHVKDACAFLGDGEKRHQARQALRVPLGAGALSCLECKERQGFCMVVPGAESSPALFLHACMCALRGLHAWRAGMSKIEALEAQVHGRSR